MRKVPQEVSGFVRYYKRIQDKYGQDKRILGTYDRILAHAHSQYKKTLAKEWQPSRQLVTGFQRTDAYFIWYMNRNLKLHT